MMKIRRVVLVAVFVAMFAAGTARADNVVNPFAGQWTTDLGGGVTGKVKFSVISATDGGAALQAMGGHPCGAPTTYYHGDYTDTGGSGDVGTMTACIVTAGHLVGRYFNPAANSGGDIDVILDSSQTTFSGIYTSDQFSGQQFPYSGTFVAHFPGDGCCSTTPPSTGGLGPPRVFCPGAAADSGPAARAAEADCEQLHFFSQQQLAKNEATADLKGQVFITVAVCRVAVKIEVSAETLDACESMIHQVVRTLEVKHDPPDPSFQSPTVAPVLPTLARYASGSCRRGLSAPKCTALRAALTRFGTVTNVTATVAGYVVTGANRFAGAVQAKSVTGAYFQAAYGKVNIGAWVIDVAAQQFYGRALAQLLQADHLGFTLNAAQVKKTVSSLPASVFSGQLLDEMVSGGLASSRKSARKLLLHQLSSVSGRVSSSALGTSLPTSVLANQYQSITLSELATIVLGQQRNGDFSSAAAQTLIGDLTYAQLGCSTASQRIAAMQQFVADAAKQAPPDAGFLKLSAQPLLASTVPAASCN
jgi:hypothetical protein